MEKLYTPYTYLIGWSKLKLFYYGSRTAKKYKTIYNSGCHPDDLMKSYFTSSPIVHSLIKQYGLPDIIQIRKIFMNNSDKCIKWERKVLIRMHVINNPKFINRDTNQHLENAIQCKIKTISIYNKETDICIKWPIEKELPYGFNKGVRKFSMKRLEKLKNRKWYTNKITGECCHLSEPPKDMENWQLKRNNFSTKGILKNKYIWINDGVNSKLILRDSDIPEGWKRGRKLKEKPSGKRKFKYIWITNGEISKQIKIDDNIPFNWVKGMHKRFSKKCRVFNKEYNSIKEAMADNNLSNYLLLKQPSFEYI